VSLVYPLVCAVVGFALAWLPLLVHGPIPYKFDTVRMNGAVAVWAFYLARLLIGVLVGITRYPPRWFLRGPLCGLIMIAPVSLISLATPGCGWG